MAESWSRSEEIQEPKDTVEFGLDSQRVALGDRRHPVGPPPAAMMQATRAGDKCAGDKDAGDKDAGDKDAGGKATGDKDEATRMQATRAGDKGAGDKYAGDKCAGDKYAGDKYAGDKDAGGKATGSGDKKEGDKVATRMKATRTHTVDANTLVAKRARGGGWTATRLHTTTIGCQGPEGEGVARCWLEKDIACGCGVPPPHPHDECRRQGSRRQGCRQATRMQATSPSRQSSQGDKEAGRRQGCRRPSPRRQMREGITLGNIEEFPTSELKLFLGTHGVTATGRKADLIDRIRVLIQETNVFH